MTNLRAQLVASFIAAGYSGNDRNPIDLSQVNEFEYGTGENAGDAMFQRVNQSIAASQTSTMDFDGVLEDAFGGTLDLATIKGVIIINTGTVNITLGGTCPAVKAVTLHPDGVYFVSTPAASGYAASAGVAGTITIQNTSGSTAASYSIAVIGVEE